MAEADRAHKPRDSSKAAKPVQAKSLAHSPAVAQRTPAWLGAPAASPFSLGGVQRKVAIGESNDRYERQADHVASRVVGGQSVPAGTISPIAPASVGGAQRESKPPENKPEKKNETASAPSPVQKQSKPDEKKKDKKPSTAPAQRAVKPEDTKKDMKSAGSQLQRQTKPAENKKRDEKAVQKQAKPDEKKKGEKPAAPPVQKQGKPDEKKKDEKPTAPPPVQKQSKPEEKKKDEKAAAPSPLQKQAKPEEKKKEEKPATPPAVQKQAKPEDKNDDKKKEEKTAAPVQRSIRPEDKKKEEVPGTLPAQRAEHDDAKKSESEPVQASRAAAATPPPSMEAAASNALATKGPGEPMAPATRSNLESRMGSDLSDVRVHNDSRAHDATSALNARAFTHGSDIWLGRGESQSDTRLMAHEATHVVQQTGSVHRMLVQRDEKPAAANAPAPDAGAQAALVSPAGEIDLAAKKMLLPQLEIPDFKANMLKSSGFVTIQKGGEERPTGAESQREIWKDKVGKTAEAAAEEKLKTKPGIRKAKPEADVAEITDDPKDPNRILFLHISGSKESYLIGTPAELRSEVTIPRWDQTGAARALDVDHKEELQLGGKNDIDNMWLLDASANRSSGSRISKQIRDSIDKAVEPHVGKPPWPKKPDAKLLRQEFEITYKTVKGNTGLDPPNKDKRWEREDIEKAEKPVDRLQALNAADVVAKHLLGDKNLLALYPLASGGRKKGIKWDVKNPTKKLAPQELKEAGFKGLHDAVITYEVGKPGAVTGIVFRREKGTKVFKEHPVNFPLREVGGLPFTVTMEKAGVLQAMRFAELYELSPVEFSEVTMDEDRGIVARGKVAPSIPIFKKLDIDILVEGDDVSLSKTFKKDDFNFPGPIKVTEAALTISVSTGGLSAEGDVLLAIEGVGTGEISATAGTGGLELSGSFDFDKKLFDPANVHVEYKDGKFSGGGKIGIKPGKVRGIKTASIDASFAEGAIDAKGSITPDIPAVEQADLSMHYDEKSGLTIGGDLQLKKDIPGIEGGSIHAELNKKGDKYTVKASGEATPKIPGINSKLTVSYDDGMFDATVHAAYEKGMLKGSVTVGATNRPVGEDGKPAAEAPSGKADKIIIYGDGSATIQLAPWLQATAGIKFTPEGEVQVTGKIEVPKAIDLFDEKKVEKNIFHIGIPIPIFPGISLNIGGGLDVNAGIGPGQLQEMEVDVTYNPAKEEDTTVHGHAALHIPAHAGLRMNVHAALDVGIPLADVEGGIELGGTLGVDGALHAAVDVDWSPKKGLVLDASAEIYAEPKLKFDITGYVKVEVGVGWFSKTLWDKRWELAAVEYGSGLRFGIKLPIHYEEGKPFNVSLSDIQFEVPNIDAMSVFKGLMDKVI